jgi:hypothetical protein
MTQMTAKAGIKKHGQVAPIDALYKEFLQLHDLGDCPHPKLLLAQDCFRDGWWYHYSQGDYFMVSIELFQHAVKIREALVLGSDDPHTYWTCLLRSGLGHV